VPLYFKMYVPLKTPPSTYYEASKIKAAAKQIIDDWNCGRRTKDRSGNVVKEVNDLVVDLSFSSDTSGKSEPADSPKNYLVLSGHFAREENREGQLKPKGPGSVAETRFESWVSNLKAVFAKAGEESPYFAQTGHEMTVYDRNASAAKTR
jgi:hypothetical protein